MSLPFTHAEFLEVFAAYNATFWPVALVLWAATALSVWRALRGHHQRFLPWLLAAHWAWAAVAYHVMFFTRVNPAAWLFALLFLTEAGLFVQQALAADAPVRFAPRGTVRHAAAVALVAYALVYPAIVWAGGQRYPSMATFGVPCPTTILTIGVLLGAAPRLPRRLAVVPLLWAVIGGSAAVLLGVGADLVLWVAGLLLAADAVLPLGASARGRRVGVR